MKVIVFGGSGFLGSHVADVLSERGHEVIIYDLKPSPYLKGPYKMVVGDILDYETVQETVKGADVVYHFAGVADIFQAKVDPIATIKQNILGTSIILDACRKNNVRRFLFASSIYVYSNSGAFYRSSKQACELIIEDYQKAYGLDFTIMRYGSLYGPRADERNWVYAMLKQATTEGKIVRKGDGEEAREYIHVHDAAEISVDMLDEKYANQRLIITGNQTIKIKDLLIMVKEMLNNNIEIKYLPARFDEHYEITPYSFNPKVAKKVFANSYFDLGQGILDMLERIHKKHLRQKSQDNICLHSK